MARRWIEQVLRVLFDRLLLLRFGYIGPGVFDEYAGFRPMQCPSTTARYSL